MKTVTTQQLELAFDGRPALAPTVRHRPHFAVARWWFARMHRTVAEAIANRRRQTDQLEQGRLELATRERLITGLASRPPGALAKAA